MGTVPKFVRIFIVLWMLGASMAASALFAAAPLSSCLVRAGLTCVCLACCVNVVSAVREKKMWGRLSVITPSACGGPAFFYSLAAIYGILAAICAVGALTFISKT